MSATPLYDKPFYLPVIVEVEDLKPEDQEAVIESLARFKPVVLQYPTDFAIEVASEMANQGYPSLTAKFPFTLSSQECNVLFAKSLKIYNQNVYVRREPDASRLQKKVESSYDFIRIVEDLLLQQDSITLSQIFCTAEQNTQVFISTFRTPINSRLSRTVISVQKASTKKAQEERQEKLETQVTAGISLFNEEHGLSGSREHSDKPFQYR
jgi:hypothetical protein